MVLQWQKKKNWQKLQSRVQEIELERHVSALQTGKGKDFLLNHKTYSILEGFVHSTSLQVFISLALPLVEVKIMTPKPPERME